MILVIETGRFGKRDGSRRIVSKDWEAEVDRREKIKRREKKKLAKIMYRVHLELSLDRVVVAVVEGENGGDFGLGCILAANVWIWKYCHLVFGIILK